jgi:hypothetical protein
MFGARGGLFGALLFCALISADFNAETWRYRRPLNVPTGAPIAEFTVDRALYRNSTANLDDLRILRDGVETPYVIRSLNGARQTIERPAAIVNKASVPGTGVQAVLDLKNHAGHNRLRIGTALHNFKEDVRVETSDDSHNWAVVQPDGVIFDVLRDEHAAAETTVDYPFSTRRFVRLTIPGWTDPANLQAAWLSDFEETNTVRDVVATLTPTVHEGVKAQTTELTLDVGAPGQPFDRIDLTVDPGLFSRTVEIASGNDMQHWFSAAGGVIFRTADEERLSLETWERTSRYLRITVFNADSAPLKFGQVTLSGIRRIVQFPAAQAGSYVAYVGNSGARPPSYDFASVMPKKITPTAATLGAMAGNPLFHPPERPWTDRHPWMLNGTLIVAVVIMGFVSLRMLGKLKYP